MVAEKRMFFRFDVSLPYYLEPMDSELGCFQTDERKIISPSEKASLKALNESLEQIFKDSEHIQNGSVEVFLGLSQKLDFMVWLLESLINGDDVLHSDQYQQHSHDQQRFIIPSSNKSSKILPLLQAFSNKIDLHIDDLSDVMKNRLGRNVFLYSQNEIKLFSLRHYVSGLDELAQKGNWLARTIVTLAKKLNSYETILLKLKKVHKKLSDTDCWPHEKINLGEGGFAVFSKQDIESNQKVCVLLKLEETFIFAKAFCVYQTRHTDKLSYNRTAFQFEEMSSENSAHIVRYLMAQELGSHQVKHD